MKKYIYRFGAVAVTLAMSGLPALALAEGAGGEGQGSIQVTSVQTEQVQQSDESIGEEQKQQLEASSTSDQGRPSVKGGREDGDFDLEENEDGEQATSLDDLKQKIEIRKNELTQEAASSTPERKDIVENANPVRLAVHSLLASKDLLGGIGSQVSEIAKQMNDSIATTTNAEAKVQARGFITRLLFGGDSTSAEVIAQAAAKNQENITKLTELLAQANVSANVQATLKAQITALQTAQARLQALAEKEQKAWGLFSWRF